jgi:hypothetical protein
MAVSKCERPPPRGSEDDGPGSMPCFAAGVDHVAPHSLQVKKLIREFRIEPALAAVVAEHAFASSRRRA